MNNAKMVVNVLLIALLFSAAYHQALPLPTVSPVNLTAFLFGENATPLPSAAQPDIYTDYQSVKAYGPVYTVTATAYQAVENQTDDEPFVTADNSFIEPDYSSKLHWLAVSRDLLVHWGGRIKYGDQVRVRGVSATLDGLYTVHDTMNKRHKHCIDILSNPEEKFDIFAKGVKIQRVRPIARMLAKQSAPRLLLAVNRSGLGLASQSAHRFVRPAEQPDYLVSAIL